MLGSEGLIVSHHRVTSHLLLLAQRLPVDVRHPELPSTPTDRPPEKTNRSQATESYFRRPLAYS